jgi:hypothetical protein
MVLGGFLGGVRGVTQMLEALHEAIPFELWPEAEVCAFVMAEKKTRAWLEERLPALRTFFGANAALKNADYRRLFGVTSRSAATRELGRLVKQGYLLAEGERRGAQYRAGPRLGEAEQK